MSTRAVIARQTNDGWEGVYQHSDGYHTGLGRELWLALHHEHGGNVLAFVHAVIDSHPGGWSHLGPAIQRNCGMPTKRPVSRPSSSPPMRSGSATATPLAS